MIGNHDRHGRNLAFVVKPNAIFLSPIYDNVSYLSLEEGAMLKADFIPTGKICTRETFEPSMKDYVIEFYKLGYKNEIYDFASKINLNKIENLVENSFCSDMMKEAIKRLIHKRYQELNHAI